MAEQPQELETITVKPTDDYSGEKYLRKSSLVVIDGEKGLDLSEMHFIFQTQAASEESPNTLTVRIYNLSKDTVRKITGKDEGVEYSRVVLNAGYQHAEYGVIFDGTIKQYRIGRENATDTYLDILAADSDEAYNFGVVNKTLEAGATTQQIIDTAAQQMNINKGFAPQDAGGVLPRGKVLWGMGRDVLRNVANTQQWAWNLNNGEVVFIALDSYLPGEAVILNSATGMIGVPEQTDEGLKVRCLLNPKLVIGGLLKIDNESINKTVANNKQAIPVGQLPYNQWAGLQLLADISNDGTYYTYVVEHTGDSRGQAWYSDIICLAANVGKEITVEPY